MNKGDLGTQGDGVPFKLSVSLINSSRRDYFMTYNIILLAAINSRISNYSKLFWTGILRWAQQPPTLAIWRAPTYYPHTNCLPPTTVTIDMRYTDWEGCVCNLNSVS